MEIREYQTNIAKQANDILNLFGLVYLSMEVRTGKTLTSFEVAELQGAKRVLFITKKKAISSILSDFKKSGYTFTLDCINFERVGSYSGKFDILVIDESHSLSAYPVPSERTKKIKVIAEGKRIIYLSGTPSPESYSQLYHQFWVSSYSPFIQYKNFYKWSKDFVRVTERKIGAYNIKDYSDARQMDIERLTKHLFLTFTQLQAGFNSSVEETIEYVEIDAKIHVLASILKRQKYYKFKDGEELILDSAVKLQSKLHQIYSGTVITELGEQRILDSSKANYIKMRFGESRIAIFYKFTAELDALKAVFSNWTNDPVEFSNNSEKVFICQISSGAMGINLSCADYLIFYNIDFSANNYWQARARIQNMQKESSKVVWIFSIGGIEEKVYKSVREKRDYTLSYFREDYGLERAVNSEPMQKVS